MHNKEQNYNIQDVLVYRSDLTRRNRITCGCIKKLPIKQNIYDLSNDDYGICYSEDKSYYFYFDKEDYDKLIKYYWSKNMQRYIYNFAYNILAHRYIMDYEGKEQIDHINGDKIDNRKCNLRICSNAENSRNKPLNKNNTSGVTWVTYEKRRNKWSAEIECKGVRYRLGDFKLKEDAIKARKNKEEELFGEFSYDNSQKIAKRNEIIT